MSKSTILDHEKMAFFVHTSSNIDFKKIYKKYVGTCLVG